MSGADDDVAWPAWMDQLAEELTAREVKRRRYSRISMGLSWAAIPFFLTDTILTVIGHWLWQLYVPGVVLLASSYWRIWRRPDS